MQASRLVALLVVGLLTVPPAQAGPVPLGFQAPAGFERAGNATGLEWALLVFHGSSASFGLKAHPERAVNHTAVFYGMMLANLTGVQAPPRSLPDQSVPADFPLDEELTFEEGWSSLFLEADHIEFSHSAAQGNLLPLGGGQSIADAVSTPLPPSISFRPALTTPHDAAAFNLRGPTGPFPFTLHATGLRRAEWSNAGTRCASACLDGAKTQTVETADAMGTYAAVLRVSYMDVMTKNGTLDGAGTAWIAAAGGRSIRLVEQGSVRLPLAARTSPCQAEPCLRPSNQTVSLHGNITLENVQPSGGNRLSADVSGALDAARLDERHLSPSFFTALPAAAAIGATLLAGAVLAKLLAWLFSRVLSPEAALKHPKRRRLHDEVQGHPGATITSLQELTGFPRTVVRKHLESLQRVGLVVSNHHAGRTHYFENHGRYATTWRQVAAQRDPDLRSLLELLLRRPGQTQRDLIADAQARGLSRSATQRRLDRLEAWGVVAVTRKGRTKRYALALDAQRDQETA